MGNCAPTSKANGSKARAAQLSIWSNTTLTLGKLVVGMLTGSVSVMAEAVHSLSDLVASFIAYFSVRVSDLPADERHPYGHGKVESLSGLAEALLIFGAAVYIISEASRKLMGEHAAPAVGPGILVMAVSAVANIGVSIYLFRVARATDSLALEADAEHLRTDVYTSMGVLGGLILVKTTGLAIMDPIVAMLVALMILHAAYRLSAEALGPLVDAQLPPGDIEALLAEIRSEPRVLGYHKLRTRKSGSSRYVDAHVQMDDDMSLLAAHQLTEELEDRIRARLPGTEVTLHTEPFRDEERHQLEQHQKRQTVSTRDRKQGPHSDSGDGAKAEKDT